MRKPILLLMVLTLSACHNEEDDKEYFIDPLLEPYYESFIQEAEQRGVKVLRENLVITLKSGLQDEFFINAQYRKVEGQRYIDIDSGWYYRRGAKIETTVFHELGHAILKRGHNTEFSLMNYLISGGAEGWPADAANKKQLIDELFKPLN